MRLWKRWLASRRRPKVMTADLLGEIRRSFEEASRDEEHFPSSIDPRIYHVKLVVEHMGSVGDGRVLDAGCGKGRYARIVQEKNPRATVVALDLALNMLRFAAAPLRPVAASLLDLPFPDACFDGAYATESLEHAVEIERAVAELCRVVKPGGRIAVIDKNAQHTGRLETPPWEKWFGRREMESLLARHCRSVESRRISYWEDVKPDGLFFAWLAVK